LKLEETLDAIDWNQVTQTELDAADIKIIGQQTGQTVAELATL
jgi:hypothetical protein